MVSRSFAVFPSRSEAGALLWSRSHAAAKHPPSKTYSKIPAQGLGDELYPSAIEVLDSSCRSRERLRSCAVVVCLAAGSFGSNFAPGRGLRTPVFRPAPRQGRDADGRRTGLHL